MVIYRGQRIGGDEIVFIRQFIADHPELSRWKLSRLLCEAWQWKQANGALRDMVCRGLLLTLDRAGETRYRRCAAKCGIVWQSANGPNRSFPTTARCANHFAASFRWSWCKCGARPKSRCSTA